MFPLSHVRVALNAMEDFSLSRDDEDLLIVGAIIPDVAEFGIADERRTHTEGRQFTRYLNKEFHYLGVGVMLHGENPKGLDYYTHRGFYEAGKGNVSSGQKGFISHKSKEIGQIALDYKNKVAINVPDAVHIIIELCFDYLTAKDDSMLSKRIIEALHNPQVEQGVINFANYFNVDRMHLKKLKRIINSKHVHSFFSNFESVEGLTHNLQDYIFLKNITTSKKGMFSKISKLAASSFGFIQTKINDKALAQMLERCVEVIRKDHRPFILSTEQKLKQMLVKEKIM